ncbi:MAG: RluA family pseudouridine synthase [Clostridiaceae bacterium]|nr:RluA family pseudouridine synthase [Clostridiaceae bacterium]
MKIKRKMTIQMQMHKYNLISDTKIRIDKFVSDKIPSLSRVYVQKLIEDGFIMVDNNKVKQNYILKDNQEVSIVVPAVPAFELKAEKIPLEIMFEDEHLLVINKPLGLVVHPGAGNNSGTLVNALLWHCGSELSKVSGDLRPGIVHRLDKDTSGLIVIAKNDYTHISLAQQLKNRLILRKYIAIVHGGIKNDSGIIDKPIGRHPVQRKKMCVTAQNS